MELNIYSIAFVLSLFMLIMLVVIGEKQNISYYVLVFVAVTVSSMGYYVVSTAESLDVATLGQRLIYIGGVFIPILILFCTMKLCHLDTPKWLRLSIIAYGILVLHYTLTIGITDDYYKNIKLEKVGDISYITKEYGPMHSLYMILLFGCIIFTFIIILYSAFKKKDVSYRTAICLLFTEIAVIVFYLWRRITGSYIEWFVVAYLVDEIIVLILIRRIGMYEVSETIANSLEEYSTDGYIVFDNKNRYTVCNDMVKKNFPEIKEQKVDTVLSKEKNEFLYEGFAKYLENPDDKKEWIVKKGDRIFKCSIKNLRYGIFDKNIGHIIEIEDDTQQQKYMNLLNNYNTRLRDEVNNQTKYIGILQDKMILNIADMIAGRDINTGGHVKRTSEVIRIFAEELEKHEKEYGFSKEFLGYLVKAAPMHDLGKIAVEDKIIRKPGSYTPEEYAAMKKHAAMGAEIVEQLLEDTNDEEFVKIAKNVANYHHERWDGHGYPQGLNGINIPLEARIMALADVFDALVSKRHYKEKMDYNTAFQVIEESLGSHFDPEIGKLFMKCRPLLEAFYDEVED